MAELPSKFDAFIHTLSRNSVSIIIVFITALFLQAPILMVVFGSFYSLIAFLAPLTIGKTFALFDWILIATEALFFIVTATFASTLATEVFGVKPEKKQILEYWKKNWKKLLPEQKTSYLKFRTSP
ncbi:unnamed protein product [marine sediment metagenome]|uniref:Uncharacterized protein n=1 Tax=marine sediment metagenome TaxID=412755 RepID=X1N6R1_9ZZZZ